MRPERTISAATQSATNSTKLHTDNIVPSAKICSFLYTKCTTLYVFHTIGLITVLVILFTARCSVSPQKLLLRRACAARFARADSSPPHFVLTSRPTVLSVVTAPQQYTAIKLRGTAWVLPIKEGTNANFLQTMISALLAFQPCERIEIQDKMCSAQFKGPFTGANILKGRFLPLKTASLRTFSFCPEY